MQHRINPELLELPGCWAEYPAVRCDAKLALIVSRVFAQLSRLKAVCNSLLCSRGHLNNVKTVLSHPLSKSLDYKREVPGPVWAGRESQFVPEQFQYAGNFEAAAGNSGERCKSI